MSIVTPSDGSRIVLSQIDWETYERLRAVRENRNLRMTYDRGRLEIMSPSKLHEWLAELVGRLVIAWTEEFGIPIQGCGSTTFQRADLERGFEPDKCFYVTHEPLVRGRDELDPEVDPPPNLAVEIDITSSSLGRLPHYAALHVPEVWRCDGRRLQILQLAEDGEYRRHDVSGVFPGLRAEDLMRFLNQRQELDETSLVRAFRDWIRATFPRNP